jgi:hypothetical protein
VTLAGRVDGTVTRLRQSGSYEVTARPASTTGCFTGRQTTDQQPGHPNRGVSRKRSVKPVIGAPSSSPGTAERRQFNGPVITHARGSTIP